MNDKQNSNLIFLYEAYNDQPLLKGLIQALSVSGISVGSMIDSSLGAYISKLKTDRLRIFFDELNKGDIILTEEQIQTNDFLHAYFETVSYVIRTKSDRKIERFATILKKLYSGIISTDEFEDYTSVFNELSDKEFAILSIKLKYEVENSSNKNNLNPLQLTSTYWDNFKREIEQRLNIPAEEINPFLIRIQRTGCYQKHKGFWDESPEDIGNTTEFFRSIYRIVAPQN